jgi:ATP-binding cassette subfamily B (MDR/TAP) protein 1
MAKSIRAAIDLTRLVSLPLNTKESEGRMTYPIEGNLAFNGVTFAYPTRADDPALKKMSFQVKAGECVGIVGCVTILSALTTLLTLTPL